MGKDPAGALDTSRAPAARPKLRSAKPEPEVCVPTGLRPLLALQRAVGNRTASGLLAAAQAKLSVGSSDDALEVEADVVARQVTASLRGHRLGSGPALESEAVVRRRAAPSGEGAAIGSAGGALDSGTESAIQAARGGGRTMDGPTRSAMEGAFGADFSGVRLHSGPEAMDLNARMHADAFTLGNDIFFRGAIPDGNTNGGLELLAHELTHTIQQGGSPVGAYRRTELHDHAQPGSWAGSCCGEIRPDGTVIRRHSSWEHSLLGDAKPTDLARIGTWKDLIEQTDKDVAEAEGRQAKRIASVALPGVGAIDKGQVMHVLVQEMARIKKWQTAPAKQESTADAVNKASKDPEFDVVVVKLPGDDMLITYGELNTLADFYGNFEAMSKADPKYRREVIQGVRKETYLRLREIYGKVNASLTKQEKKQRSTRDAKAAFGDEELGTDKLNREQTTFKGAMKPDYISGKPGQIELLMGVQKIGTTGAVNEYGAGLARNACHFAPESWMAWADCHATAIDKAKQSFLKFKAARALEDDIQQTPGMNQGERELKQALILNCKDECSELANEALLHNGFGDHYLQDSYASGHLINKTRIMQWYVEYIDTTDNFDYFKDANWRKVQEMAYKQEGISSPGQYDKKKVRGYNPADANPNRPRNPQSVENIGGDDWTVRFTALGLTVPQSLRDPTSNERAAFEWWQGAAATDSGKAKRTGAQLRTALAGLGADQVTLVVGNLVSDGIVYAQDDVSKRGAQMTGARNPRLRGEAFDGNTFTIRPEYVPSQDKLREFRKAKKAADQGDDTKYQKMAQAVTYGDYIEFMSSSFIQKATNALHDVFCKDGLLVKTKGGDPAFKVYGDDAMFSAESSKGVAESGATANMSRDSILSIINTNGEGANTTKAIMDRLPMYVQYKLPDGSYKTDSLETWHNPNNADGLKNRCMTEIFPGMAGSVVQKFAPGVISPTLGQITRDTPHGSDVF